MEQSLYLEELYKISEQMGSGLDIEDLVELIMEGSIKVSSADEGSLMLLDEATSTLRIMVAKGLSKETKESVTISLGQPIAGVVARDGKPILLTEELKEEKFSNVHHEGRRIKSAISLPLKIKDNIIGVLNLNITKSDRVFSEEDIQPLSIFATQAAIAIENARLYKTTTKRTEELLILNRAGKVLSATFQEEEVLNTMVNTILEIIEFDVSASFLFNEDYSILTITSFKQEEENVIETIKDKLTTLLSDLTTWDFKKNIVVKTRIKEGLKPLEKEQKELQSHLLFPLVAKEEVIGAVSIHSFKLNFFKEEHLHTLSILAPQVAIAIENARIYQEMQNLYTETIKALAAEIETRNPYTLGHSERVTDYSVMVAKSLNLPSSKIELIKYAGLLHDLGKIGISDNVLLKPGKLTDQEFAEIKSHPLKSESIIKIITFLKDALPVVRHHHEHYDGGGYPDGLAYEKIPLESRILAVADAYDAMTSDRPYRGAMSKDEAINILKKCSGTQFDPQVVSVFVSLIDEKR
ncbi:MAG: HD domain-containing phosphohydrolase [bacterium]